MDRGFVIACRARSPWFGCIRRRDRSLSCRGWQPRRANGSANKNAEVAAEQKRPVASLAGCGSQRVGLLYRSVLCGLQRQWADGLSGKKENVGRAGPPDQNSAAAEQRNGK